MKYHFKRSLLFSVMAFFHNSAIASQPKNTKPISTLQEALFNVRKIIVNFPTNDAVAAQAYEKQQSITLVQCAKILYDNAHAQILQALQEIDNRIVYWRYQKDHQWSYFLAKNPLKWFTGPQQNVEIKDNLEQLYSHQGELYVLLGQLAEHGIVYDREYKAVFVADYTKAYAWIDGLLDLLLRIKVPVQNLSNMSPFIVRATQLKLKLTKVRGFKNDILSEIAETQIPMHIERNWLKYVILFAIFGQGYKYADQISEFTLTSLTSTKKSILSTAEDIKKIFFPGKIGREGVQGDNNVTYLAMINFLDKMEAKNIINEQEKKNIIEDVAKGSSDEFRKFMNNKIMTSLNNQIWYGTEGWGIFSQLFVSYDIGKEISGVRNIALLAPATAVSMIVGGLGYLGYRKVMARDYTLIRRSLVDINSLFVDTTKPLDDERYGRMIYLVYKLKKQADKNVPLVDRTDFIEDLDKIASKEFDVAAKRRIVDDMFRKYSFLR